MLPQIMPVLHKNYFQLKEIESTDAGRVLCSTLICLKAGHKFLLYHKEQSDSFITGFGDLASTGVCINKPY